MRPEALADIARNRSLSVAGRRVDVGALRVIGDGTNDNARLTPKALGVLLELAREPGVTRTREELLERVWGGAGGNDVLTQAVKELRRVFCDDPTDPRFIETVPRLGYRLLADVDWNCGRALPEAANQPVADTAVQLHAAYRRRTVFTVVCTLAMVAATFVMLDRRGDARVAAVYAARVEAAPTLTTDPGAETAPRVSPDGTRVAYVAADIDSGRPRVHLRSVAGAGTLRPTHGGGDESSPVWSADGSELAFVRASASACEFVTVPALGGAERRRGTCDAGMTGDFDWSPDGTQFVLATARRGDTARLAHRSVTAGEAVPFDYAHDPNQHDAYPRYAPDGRRIAFRRGLPPYFDLYVVGARGGAVRRVTRLGADIHGFDWLPDGRSLVFASSHGGAPALYRVDADGGNVEPLGVGLAQSPAFARQGRTAVYEVPRLRTTLRGIVLGDAGAPSDVAASTGSDSQPALSPDDTRVAFISDRNGRPQLWLYDGAERQAVALTHDADAQLNYPEWNGAGTHVLVTRRRNGVGQLVEIDLASQTQRAVSPPQYDVHYGIYAPSGGFLAIVQHEDGPRLLRFASDASLPAVLARNASWVGADAVAGDVYYSRPDGQTVLRLAPGGAQTVDDSVVATIAGGNAWRIAAGALWYLDADADRHVALKRRALAGDGTGETQQAWRSDEPIDASHFSIGADAHRVLVTGIVRDDTDIGLLRIIGK
ncbi:winged helix-turn-helix domain-containing protein [Tahibacter soli]|uniref:Winged helix-turn-helix domain-containing protein n=1 Tax=Tahibacter soli TaxID=2983605 RepID=A0A9X3YFW3_9GAMM|nr:winged helix-turn-helix domain-containing protein [Tahibacter soli]MDC8011259.1 winged helix-turn-helix domain-containing protein [Tahibacter soli]